MKAAHRVLTDAEVARELFAGGYLQALDHAKQMLLESGHREAAEHVDSLRRVPAEVMATAALLKATRGAA